ncbi:MAG TPA: ABC transporter permease [Gemmatimonadaceae bacterium]|nr:ABC transporter permease [Gemmatimonadaceae bacterium]
MKTAERIYQLLLRLYPSDFRHRYGRAMSDFHADRLATARAGGESISLLWVRTVLDVCASALAEHLRSIFTEEAVVQTIVQDVGYAVRGLLRRPGFTAIVVGTIALGVGANAAIFSVVNVILLTPLPYPHAGQVVSFGHAPPQWLTSEPNFVDYHRELKRFDGLAAYTRNEVTLTTGDESERLRLVRASDDFFPLLGVRPLLGRTFAAGEFVEDPPQVVMLSYGLWQRRFGGERGIVGKSVWIGGIPRTVVGVMPPHFDFPEARTDIWSPLPHFRPDSLNGRGSNYLFMVGRLRTGITPDGALVEANELAKRIVRDFPNVYDPNRPLIPVIARVGDRLVGGTRPYLVALVGAVGFVLLIACANVANLLLVRGESRHKEMALRSALGASRFRLLSQLFTESSLLALASGALGLLLAWAGDRALLALAPPSIPRLDLIGIDWHVVAFTAVVALGTGVSIGIAPAWRTSHGNAADALKDGGRIVASTSGARGLRRVLVVAEVAFAVVTLAGAGVLLRSLWNLQSADLGYDPRSALTAKVSLPAREYSDARSAVFFDQLVHRLRATPGVIAVGASGWLPVVDAGGLWGFEPEGKPFPPGRGPSAVPQHATPGYFAALGLRVVAGREFNDADRDGAQSVAIVSERFAETTWPGERAIGHRFKLGGPSPWLTVVGVVRDIRSRGFADTPEPTMYFPYAQTAASMGSTPRSMAVILRVTGDPMSLMTNLRNAVRGLDRNVPLSEVRTLEQVVGTSVSNRRFNTGLLATFALLALLLAGIGTYGVISYGVSQRSYEIGVRIALGAETRSVLRLVMSEGVVLCAIGLVVGLAASVGVGRALTAMLVGVRAFDIPTMGATSLLLAMVAIAASVVPARRALRVSPVEAMRG